MAAKHGASVGAAQGSVVAQATCPAARAEYEKKRSESVFATLSLRDGAVHQGC